MDVNNTNSVQNEQFDDVKNNIEITVEVKEITETVNENESLNSEVEAAEISAQKPEDNIIVSNEEILATAESEEKTDKIEDSEIESDEISVQKPEDSIIVSNEETLATAESEEKTDKIEDSEIESDEISAQKPEDNVIDFYNEEALIASESEEFDLEDDGEIDSEEETEVSIDFSNMNKAELVAAFKTILETQPVEKIRRDVDVIKTSFYKILRREQDVYKQEYLDAGNDIENYVAPIDKDEIEFKSLFNSYKTQHSAYIRNLESNKEENYGIKLKLIDELKVLIDKKEDINLTFQKFKEIQRRWKETGPIPQSNMKDLWDTYNHHVENFYDYLKINKELRDMDFKKNLEAKIQLCEKAEELLLEPSIVNAFRKLQKYHEQWRETGPVANELKEQIWERFKEATSKINKKHQEYFDQQKGMYEQNFKAKIILCEKIEELLASECTTNKEWNKASKALVEMQKAWKSIGFASKKDNVKIYLRFRKACDEFFTRKRKFYGEFKTTMEENYRLKLDLCERAEAIAKSTDWKKTTDQFVKLQKEWQKIGIVPRKVSNEIWKRFRTACDTFFHARNSLLKEENLRYNENLKAKEEIIKEIKEYKANTNVLKNLDAIKEFQRRWAAIGYVPIKEKSRVQSEYRNALDNLFTVLNVSEKDRKIVKFRTRIESAYANKGQIKSLRNERDKLLGQIRQIESDIALWENNIGFFAKSKNADTVVSEVRRKIEKGKEEVQLLEEKIKLLDQTI
ncbi:MAG: DUF349 domain-containing protein [Prevotellaceae bacterium]|jgi:hypothetical protein|nr:DUF349 domain-containing protein [Prevotellaceae bacterium]